MEKGKNLVNPTLCLGIYNCERNNIDIPSPRFYNDVLL